MCNYGTRWHKFKSVDDAWAHAKELAGWDERNWAL